MATEGTSLEILSSTTKPSTETVPNEKKPGISLHDLLPYLSLLGYDEVSVDFTWSVTRCVVKTYFGFINCIDNVKSFKGEVSSVSPSLEQMVICSDERLTFETSAWKLLTVAFLHYQLR